MSETLNIPQFEPLFGDEERRALDAYMAEGGWITEFRKTAAFEEAVAAFVGARHCIAVNSGSVALMVANMAVGVGSGDEVIVPNYTMIATPNAARILGATPVFVDVEQETLCMDVRLARTAITSRTKAVVLVTSNGRYPRTGIAAFESLCDEHALTLIEDAAQGLGSYYPDGRHVGTAGRLGCFSFSTPKIISTGQGGCIVTDDDALGERLRRLKDFGRSGGGNDIHDTFGFNFKFTDLQACVGLAQMGKLADRIARKREIFARYRAAFEGIDAIRLFDHDLDRTTPWFIDALVEDRDGLQSWLKARGIGTRPMYPPINRQLAYDVPGTHPVSDEVGRSGLWLPSSVQLTDEEIDSIADIIRQFRPGATGARSTGDASE